MRASCTALNARRAISFSLIAARKVARRDAHVAKNASIAATHALEARVVAELRRRVARTLHGVERLAVMTEQELGIVNVRVGTADQRLGRRRARGASASVPRSAASAASNGSPPISSSISARTLLSTTSASS